MLDPKQCVLFSGGAAGTEQFFGAQAEAWGIEEVNFSFEGHQLERKRGVRVLTSDELALKDVSMTYVSRLMGREYTGLPCSARCSSPSAGRSAAGRKSSW